MGIFTEMANFMVKSDVGGNNLYDHQFLKDRFSDFKRQYESKNPGKQYAKEIYGITDKFLKDNQFAYLKFGLYWWAVKRILAKAGFSGYDGEIVHTIADSYVYRDTQGNVDEISTLLAGWEHKDDYNRLYIQGNRHFTLKNGDLYELIDHEWELQNFI